MRTTQRLWCSKAAFWSLTALWACSGLSSKPLSHHPGPTAESLPSLLRLLPADTLALIGLPAAQASADQPAGQLRSEILFAAGLKDELEKLQPLLDAVAPGRRMLLAALADPEGGWVALVPGPLQEADIQAAARQAGFSDIRQEDDALRLATSNGGNGSEPLLIVRRPELLLAGEAKAVRRCLEQQGSSPEAFFMERVQQIAPDAQIWGVARRQWLDESRLDPKANDLPQGFLLKSLEGLKAVVFSARVGSVVDFRMRTETSLEAEARVLVDELSEFIADAAPESAPAEVRRVMQSAQVEQQGGTVGLQLSITQEAMARIKGNAASRSILRWRLPAADRERNQKVADLFAWLPAQAGMRVADVGAGRGFMTFRMARQAGPEGKVYAVEILPKLIERLQERARRNALTQVEAVLGDEDDPHLPVGELDSVLIVNAYHEMPHYQEMLRHILAALRPGGRLVLSEPYSPSRSGESRSQQAENHEIAPDLAQQDLQEAGFEILHRQDDFLIRRHNGHEHRDWLIVAARVSGRQ